MMEVISDLKSMRRLEGDWNRLAADHGSPMMQFDWFFHAAETLCDESRLRVFVYRRESKTCAIAPLVLRQRQHTPWLEILGAAELYEPANLLYHDETSLRGLLQAIAATRVPVNLQRLPASSPIFAAADAACRGRALLLTRPTAPSSYIAIGSDWDTFYRSLAASRRADFRKKLRRAEGAGEAMIATTSPTGAELEETLNRCFQIEAASWKGRNGTALRDNPPLRRFFEHYAEAAARKGMLRMFLYSVGGQPVAMHIAVEFQRRLWIYKLGHDETWSRVSPGMHLANETIRYAFEHQLDGYEFLGSEEPWQHAWPVSTHAYRSLLIYPVSWQGLRGLFHSGVTFVKNRIRADRDRSSTGRHCDW